jgi:hypothetical protein
VAQKTESKTASPGEVCVYCIVQLTRLCFAAKTGAFIGFVSWLGFIAATHFPQGIYESPPPRLFAINSGYWLVGLLTIGGLLAIWS